MDEKQLELDINELGLTAPRITLAHINALMEKVTYYVNVPEGTTTTLVTAFYDGFSLCTEISACVDPSNFNAELGKKIALEKAEKSAKDKLWELEGWRLKRKIETKIADIAQACHEVNRAYCVSIGDDSQVAWEDAPQWQQNSAIQGVMFNMANPDEPASANHTNWLKDKEANGRVYGEVKDPDKKEHPCMVPYDQLPVEQQMKYTLFKLTVAANMNI